MEFSAKSKKDSKDEGQHRPVRSIRCSSPFTKIDEELFEELEELLVMGDVGLPTAQKSATPCGRASKPRA